MQMYECQTEILIVNLAKLISQANISSLFH